MANHFNKLAKLCWALGRLDEVAIKLEGYDNSNEADKTSIMKAYVSASIGTSGTYNGGSIGSNAGSSGSLLL